MNITDLPEEEIKKLKNKLIEDGTVFETKGISSCNAKFFEVVTVSNVLIKFFLFFSLGLYTAINLIAVVLSIIYDFYNFINPIETVVGVFIIDFIVVAIFSNVNTNKKKEESVMCVKDDHFIFNFNDGITDTPRLFYSPPYTCVKKIDFLIYSLKKKQLFGNVTFTFDMDGYEATHTIKFTNLTKIEQLIKSAYPSLKTALYTDGKNIWLSKPEKKPEKTKYILIAFAMLIASTLSIAIPITLKYHSVALIATSVILFIATVLIFLSCFVYLFSLVKGIVISSVFTIIGFCIPLLIMEIDAVSVWDCIIQNTQILMPTVFGIIGLCLFAYSAVIVVGKTRYVISKRKNKNF